MAVARPESSCQPEPSPELIACMAVLDARLGLLEASLGL